MKPVRILSAKKLQPNQRQYLLNAGFAVLQADFIGIKYKDFNAGGVAPNLIFTSKNAVGAVLAKLGRDIFKERKVFCVGDKTRIAALKAGAEVVATEDYAESLAGVITGKYSDRTFTFFSGSLRRDVLPTVLSEAGVQFSEIEVYETALTPHKINTQPDGILFFSPSAVESFLKENSIGSAVCFCIGNTTAAALAGITDKVVIANKPSVENVIIQCINYYKENTRSY